MSLTPKETAIAALIFCVLIGVLAWSGERDYRDAKIQEAHTCGLVAEGRYPHAAAPYCPPPSVTMTPARYGGVTARRLTF